MKRWIFATVALSLLAALPVDACPEETVDYGTLLAQQFSGRILALEEWGLPGENVHFVIRERGTDDAEEQEVLVGSNGEFVHGLPLGRYDCTIKVDGFLFTVVGIVEVSSDPKAAESLTFSLPWC